MSRRVTGVTLDNLELLPRGCRRCVYWELAPHLREQAEEFGETEVEKEAWISSVLLEWGSCGRIIHSGDVPVGFVLYAPPNAVPRAGTFPTSPPGADAVLLTAFHVLPEFRGSGLGRALVQAVVQDLTRRGVRAVEAFGDARAETGGADHASDGGGAAQRGAGDTAQGGGTVGGGRTDRGGETVTPHASGHVCVVPAEFLRAVGFKTVAAHPHWPRLRLELRSGLSWKADVEAALEKLLDEVSVTTATSSAARA
ncbi:GNAT family N-acetyltransferase [Saccharomonospora saliphila]|uniref:GNAT family N-acetyltransferase n=1 Tax=Saccharomonospora saliphila TaxID=369829 RepID=UPI0003A0F214|nr:GNAT family N-acetyltransferase [Saccharomonospora saliphila]